MIELLEGFRDVVESLDLTTDAGRETFAALMELAPAFAQVSITIADLIANAQASTLNTASAAFAAFCSAIIACSSA